MFYGILVFVLSLFSCEAFSKSFEILQDKKNSVTWVATGYPSLLKIEAEGGKVHGSGEIKDGMVSGTFWSALDEYDTGMDLRNKHMREKYLDTAKYPKAKLVLDPVKADSKKFSGMLEIKDTKKPVSGDFKVEGNSIWAKFRINITDYPSIGVPSYLGITVGDHVDIVIKADYK